MDDLTIITAENISEARTHIGQNDEKVKNSAQEFVKTPASGKFASAPSFKAFIISVLKEGSLTEYEDKEVKSLGYLTENNEFVSENNIFSNTVTDTAVEVKSVKNKGKYMFKQSHVSGEDVWNGASQDARLLNLAGKTFTTTSVEGRALKLYTVDKMFVASNEAPYIAMLEKNVEPKTYHKFVVQ